MYWLIKGFILIDWIGLYWLIDWFQYQCRCLFLRTRCPLHDPTQNVQQAFHSGRDQVLLQQRKLLIYVIGLQNIYHDNKLTFCFYIYWCTKDIIIKFNDIYAYVLFSYFTWREWMYFNCVYEIYSDLWVVLYKWCATS